MSNNYPHGGCPGEDAPLVHNVARGLQAEGKEKPKIQALPFNYNEHRRNEDTTA